jgi:signal transduction histidine kinase
VADVRRPTLRTRATLLATLITALVLLAGSMLLVLTLETRLTTGSDQLARSRIRDLLELAAAGDLPGTLSNVNDEGVAQVVDTRGRVLAASPNIRGRPPVSDLDPGQRPTVRTVRAPDDTETETYRLWAGAGVGADGPVVVYVGSSLESVREATSTLRRELELGAPVLLLLLAAGAWLVLGGALRRVERIRTEVDTITEERLDRRVPESGTDDEIGRLAGTMNRMLARLEASQDRQRAFVADVSHDLQSPLAAQRAQLEVALSRADPPELAALGRDLLGTTGEMERLVRDLLFLAAADADATPRETSPIDVDDIVLEEAARARPGSVTRIDTTGVSAAPARAAADDVRRIVRNLLDNALVHAAGLVELRARTDGTWTWLEVVDDGPGVAAEDRDQIFDRFHRGDRARSRHTAGSGLGLAIARTLAERQGGRLTLETEGPGARFLLRLPGTAG